jgi:hypothetical protein
MTVLKVVPIEEQPKPTTSQWSLGLTMFAAFVVPFLLFATSARYRVFLAQAKAKIVATQRQATGTINNTGIHWPIDNHD